MESHCLTMCHLVNQINIICWVILNQTVWRLKLMTHAWPKSKRSTYNTFHIWLWRSNPQNDKLVRCSFWIPWASFTRFNTATRGLSNPKPGKDIGSCIALECDIKDQLYLSYKAQNSILKTSYFPAKTLKSSLKTNNRALDYHTWLGHLHGYEVPKEWIGNVSRFPIQCQSPGI